MKIRTTITELVDIVSVPPTRETAALVLSYFLDGLSEYLERCALEEALSEVAGTGPYIHWKNLAADIELAVRMKVQRELDDGTYESPANK